MKGTKLYYRTLGLIVLLLVAFHASAVAVPKDSIYGGTQIKLDIASPIIVPAATGWHIQHYELAANVRLAQRFYPTLELGYAGGATTQGDSVGYNGHGGFFRVGCDLNPLKKHPESPHALLVGVRLGTAVQDVCQGTITDNQYLTAARRVQADCWGEIVIGCQVEVWKERQGKSERGIVTAVSRQPMAFYMGWMGRLKCLFTRQKDGLPIEEMNAVYIPGYGTRDNIGWGVNYYLGWRF